MGALRGSAWSSWVCGWGPGSVKVFSRWIFERWVGIMSVDLWNVSRQRELAEQKQNDGRKLKNCNPFKREVHGCNWAEEAGKGEPCMHHFFLKSHMHLKTNKTINLNLWLSPKYLIIWQVPTYSTPTPTTTTTIFPLNGKFVLGLKWMFEKQTWSALNTKICLNNTEVVTAVDKARKFKAMRLTHRIEFCCCWHPSACGRSWCLLFGSACEKETFLRWQDSFFFGKNLCFKMLFISEYTNW